MTEYLLLFRNASGPDAYLTTAQDMANDLPKWQTWIGRMAGQGKLISTAPVRYEGCTVDKQGRVANDPYKEPSSVLVSGFLLCKSESLEEVQAWSKDCPILNYPSSTVEIRPLVSFPTQQ